MSDEAVVAALGKIGDPAALKPVQKTLREKGRYARRSAAIALGLVGVHAPPPTVALVIAFLLHRSLGWIEPKPIITTGPEIAAWMGPTDFDDWLVVGERKDGLRKVRVLAHDGNMDRYLEGSEEALPEG